MTVFLGTVDGGFSYHGSLLVGNPGRLAAGDFDEDGNVDVVATIINDTFATFFAGDGLGGLERTSDILLPGTASSVKVADLDRDGHLDVLLAIPQPPRVAVLYGDGTGAFPDSRWLLGFYAPTDAMPGQFDDLVDPDGPLDLLITDPGRAGITFVAGTGGREFVVGASAQTLADPLRAAAGDLDEDGHTDVVVVYAGSANQTTVTVRLGSGFGTFPDRTDLSFPWAEAFGEARIRDWNLDGHRDLLLTQVGSSACMLPGLGNGTFAGPLLFGRHDLDGPVTSGDFDRDGSPDLALVGLAHVDVFRNRSFTPERCRRPNTDLGDGTPVDVLSVNGETGGSVREVYVSAADPLEVWLDRAPVPAAGGRYYAAVWAGAPDAATVDLLPAGLGFGCFEPVRVDPDYAEPLHVANTIRPNDPRLDPPGGTATGVPGSALPAAVLDIPAGTFPPGTVLTAQGIVGDGNSLARKAASLTNAVVIRVL